MYVSPFINQEVENNTEIKLEFVASPLRTRDIKDAMPVSFRSELFTSYILTIFEQWNLIL